jgi:hypothetical protein
MKLWGKSHISRILGIKHENISKHKDIKQILADFKEI